MTLPKIKHPIFSTNLPTTDVKISFRPMLQKDEKILLIAKESNEPSDILAAIKQVVNNCIVGHVDIDKWPIIDLEWVFVKLRAASVSNTTKVSYIDGEDQKPYDFEINLDDIKVTSKPSFDKIIVDQNTYVSLRYPPASLYNDKAFLESTGDEALSKLIVSTIDTINVNGVQYDSQNLTSQEIDDYLGEFTIPVYNQFRDFLFNLPHLEYEIKYKNSLDHDRKIVLASLNDFFSLA